MKKLDVSVTATHKGKKPKPGSMIVANTEDGEWAILMYDRENIGYMWECEERIVFDEWFYLSELTEGLA